MTNKYTVINVVNWGFYQYKENQSDQLNDQQMTNRRPADDQQMTTDNNVKQSKTMYNNVVVVPKHKSDHVEVIQHYQNGITVTTMLK